MSVTDQINEPRYPSFKGIMAAKKKPVEQWGLADLGIDPSQVGLGGRVDLGGLVRQAPAARAGPDRPDEGDGGTKLAEFLAGQKFI